MLDQFFQSSGSVTSFMFNYKMRPLCWWSMTKWQQYLISSHTFIMKAVLVFPTICSREYSEKFILKNFNVLTFEVLLFLDPVLNVLAFKVLPDLWILFAVRYNPAGVTTHSTSDPRPQVWPAAISHEGAQFSFTPSNLTSNPRGLWDWKWLPDTMGLAMF